MSMPKKLLDANASLIVTTKPATEPVSLTEAKAHLRVDSNDENTLITALTVAARRWCEQRTGMTFITTVYRLTLDGFSGSQTDPILLPSPPLISVDEIRYIDTDYTWQTLPSNQYEALTGTTPGRLIPASVVPSDAKWPSTAQRSGAVQIDYTAGFGSAANVPEDIKQAILLLVGEWHEFREAAINGTVNKIPNSVEALLSTYSLPEAV